jgi:hypothetical protein
MSIFPHHSTHARLNVNLGSATSKTLLNSRLRSYERNIGVSAKLGSFTVTPLQAEGLSTGASFRSPRISLTVSLAPYDPQTFIPPTTGPAFIWTDVSVILKHTDPTKRGIYILIRVFDESALGRKACIGMLFHPPSSSWYDSRTNPLVL